LAYTGPRIDADVHHAWRDDAELLPYIPTRWRQAVADRQFAIGPAMMSYPHTAGVNKRLDTYPPIGGPPGSDVATMQRQLLDPHNVSRVVLGFDVGLNAAVANPYLALALVQALNDWSIDRWLSQADDRLYGALLAPTHVPEEAAAEIRRVGGHPRIAQVLLPWNSLGRPFGHPVYHPIYAAAEELGLPIAIHAGGGEVAMSTGQTAAGGVMPTRLEFHTVLPQTSQHHLLSFITHGVFERFPNLRLMLSEVGVTWVPWLLWSMDASVDELRRESDWVRRLPSEYFFERVCLTTQPLEETPQRSQLIELLEAVGGLEDVLCFASDYPHWDTDEPNYVERRLPEAWLPKVFYENARRFFGWDTELPPAATSAQAPA